MAAVTHKVQIHLFLCNVGKTTDFWRESDEDIFFHYYHICFGVDDRVNDHMEESFYDHSEQSLELLACVQSLNIGLCSITEFMCFITCKLV